MSDEPVGDEPGYELVMPFVVVESVGGVYDDVAFAAGWTMGRLDATIATVKALGLGSPAIAVTVPRACVAQVDLLAMAAGARVVELPMDDKVSADQWACLEVTWEPLDG